MTVVSWGENYQTLTFDASLSNRVVPFDKFGSWWRQGWILARGRRAASASGRAALAVVVATSTAWISAAATGGVAVVLAIDGAVAASRRGGLATSIPAAGRARSATILVRRRAHVVTFSLTLAIEIARLRVGTATPSIVDVLAREIETGDLGGCHVAHVGGIGQAKDLQGRSPLVLGNSLCSQELQELKLLLQGVRPHHARGLLRGNCSSCLGKECRQRVGSQGVRGGMALRRGHAQRCERRGHGARSVGINAGRSIQCRGVWLWHRRGRVGTKRVSRRGHCWGCRSRRILFGHVCQSLEDTRRVRRRLRWGS